LSEKGVRLVPAAFLVASTRNKKEFKAFRQLTIESVENFQIIESESVSNVKNKPKLDELSRWFVANFALKHSTLTRLLQNLAGLGVDLAGNHQVRAYKK